MLPIAWKSRARAPEGRILVQRDEMASQRHGLIVPDSYLDHTRTAFGRVLDIHPRSAVDYSVGDHVLLSSIGGHQIIFGLLATEETEIWVYSDSAVKMVFGSEPQKIVQEDEHVLRNRMKVNEMIGTVDEKWVDGERQGLR